MKVHTFLSHVDHDKIHRAVQEAQRGTSARIVVYIGHHFVGDAMTAALPLFRKLGLETSPTKTGLLLFIAPKSRNFAVLGGAALHAKLGQAWWNRLAASITAHFKEERYTDGLLAALHEAGHSLKSHFPSTDPRPAGEVDIYDR